MLKLARLTAWILVAALVFVTLAPIGMRPVVVESANLERAMAYALMGFMLALAYPRHWLWALAAGVALAGLLEAAQGLTASRHGRVADFLVKAVAASLGALGAQVVLFAGTRWERRRAVRTLAD